MKKQILTMGGGGFTSKPENLKLDKYLLSLSDKKNPKVCFIPTASGDDESYKKRFYSSYKKLNCETSHLSLFSPPEGDLRDFVLEKDIFYVGGGNTRNLLVLWKEWGLDKCLGFLQGSNCPHFDTEIQRRPEYHKAILNGTMKPGIACDDGVAAHFIDGKLERCVSSLLNAKAYSIKNDNSIINESVIEPEYLDDKF
jgi:dipeptidase E